MRSVRTKSTGRPLITALNISVLVAASLPAHAATLYTWTPAGTDTQWSNPANWNPASVPSSGDNAYILAKNQSYVVNFDSDYPAESPLFYLDLSASTSSSIVFNQSGHSFYVASSATVPSAISLSANNNSAVTYNLSGGTLSTINASLTMFASTGSSSSFNLSGGLLDSPSQFIQPGSTFTQTGGTNAYTNLNFYGGKLSYSLAAGLLTGTNMALWGSFNQTGGTNSVTSALTFASQSGNPATYLLQNGSLAANRITMTLYCTLTQTGGNISASTFSQGSGATILGGPQSLYNFPSFSVINGNLTLTPDADKLLVTSNLTLSGNHALDLTTNDFLVHSGASSLSTTYSSIRNHISDNRLYSSSSSPITTLALMKSSDYLALHGPDATFDGQPLTPNDLLVKYTYTGDADLDGLVTLNDYALLEAAFLFGNFNPINNPASWVNGDFNHDGKIDAQDFALIDAAFAAQSGTLAADEIAAHALQFGTPYLTALQSLTPIPEPATLSLLALAIPTLLRRHRHRLLLV